MLLMMIFNIFDNFQNLLNQVNITMKATQQGFGLNKITIYNFSLVLVTKV